MNQDKKLLFIYNADSSLFNQMADLIHKAISPKTYQCNLCRLTYSGSDMKRDWKDFIDSLPIKAKFFHKDEFLKQYPDKRNTTFPTVFVEDNSSLRSLISTEEINQLKGLNDLKTLVEKKLSAI